MDTQQLFDRWVAEPLAEKLTRPFVHLMFGARQTGKSTLLLSLLPADTLRIDLSNPEERSRLLARPAEFTEMCRALPERKDQYVFVDEAQAAPAVFDAVQHLYDGDKTRWRFVLCGSSARRLRRAGANMLPGRSFLHRLFPLILPEHPAPLPPISHAASPLPMTWPSREKTRQLFPAWDLEERIAYGSLPGIVASPAQDRAELLKAYSLIYLEEEIRREALIKDWGAFVRFLQLAAMESGGILNFANIAPEAGVSQPTVKSYYQLLEDIFIGFRIPAYSRSRRKNLLSTPKFLFFDMGVRHAAAGLMPSPELAKANPGPLFEHWVGIELWKRLQYLGDGQLFYYRTRHGAEVDFIIERQNTLTPIEVKWTTQPDMKDARHLLAFLREHPDRAEKGYIVCRCPRPLQVHEKVTAIPWHCM